MIRGKYLRERKAIKVKRRMKFLLAILILCLLHKVLFSSYSLYESEASSTADIDVAFYTLEDEYTTKVISLEEMIPGDTRRIEFSVSNYYIDDAGENVISETDMIYDLKIRTTTNLPLEYKLYKNQGLDVDNLTNILEIETVQNENMHLDEDNTIFKHLVLANQTEESKTKGITDSDEFFYKVAETNTYILEVTLPEQYNSIEYQNIIECIELTIDSEQRIDGITY